MTEKRKKLTKLVINRVDLVDRGANQDAHVVLFKRDRQTKEPDMLDVLDLVKRARAMTTDADLVKALDWFGQIHSGLAAAVEKQDAPGSDFDDVMVRRNLGRVMQRVFEFANALDETLGKISGDLERGHKDKRAKDAIESFVRAIKADLPDFIDQSMKGLAKGDRELLAPVAELVHKGEPKMTDKKVDKTDDKKTAPDIGLLRKMFAGMATMLGASAEDVAKIDPPDDDIWKGVSPALRKRIEASETATAAEVTKREAAEKRVAKLERDVTLADVRKEVASFKHMGLDPDKDTELFEKMTAGLSDDEAKRMREIFAGADTAIEAGKLFAEVGNTGLGDAPAGDQADSEIEKRITAVMAKAENKEMTRDQAMDAVMRADPQLYERYRAENQIKV